MDKLILTIILLEYKLKKILIYLIFINILNKNTIKQIS